MQPGAILDVHDLALLRALSETDLLFVKHGVDELCVGAAPVRGSGHDGQGLRILEGGWIFPACGPVEANRLGKGEVLEDETAIVAARRRWYPRLLLDLRQRHHVERRQPSVYQQFGVIPPSPDQKLLKLRKFGALHR